MIDEQHCHPERTSGTRLRVSQGSGLVRPSQILREYAQDDSRSMIPLVARLPSVLIVITCCALPLAWIVVVIAGNPSVWADVRLSSFRMELLARTLAYNFGAALMAGAMGLPAGLGLGRR